MRRRKYSEAHTIAMIHEAGGLAVLAHPYTLNLSNAEMCKILRELRGMGLDGVEGYYSTQPEAVSLLVRKEAMHLGLLISGGSDFHGDIMPHIQLGLCFENHEIPDALWEVMKTRICHVKGIDCPVTV